MQPIFHGQLLSQFMNQNLRKIREQVDSLTCPHIIDKSDNQLSDDLDRLLEPLYAATIPVLHQTKIEKLFSAEKNLLMWDIPYRGSSMFFNLQPSNVQLGQRASVTGDKLRIAAAKSPADHDYTHTENDLKGQLNEIEKTLEVLRDDYEKHFGREKTKAGFLTHLIGKRDNCKEAVPAGYKLV